MELKRLEVEHWRGLSEKTAVPFDPRITMIGGPNESGKSSLRHALRAALLLPSGARGEKKQLEALRPWDTKLYPRVLLEIEIGGDTWLVEKTFLRGKDWATLKKGGRLVATDGEVGAMLLSALGPSAEWIDVLWGIQGEQVREADLAVPESVKGRLAAAARETVTPAVAQLEERISRDFGLFWTDKLLKPKGELEAARRATEAGEIARDAIKREYAEAEEATGRLAGDQAALARVRERASGLKELVERGLDGLAAWETYEKNQSEARAAKAAADMVERWLSGWKAAVARVVELWPRAAEYRIRIEALEPRVRSAPSRAEIDALTARQRWLAMVEMAEAGRRLAELDLPDPPTLKRIKTALSDLHEAEVSLKAAELQATLTAATALSVSLERDGDEAEVFDIPSGMAASWTAERAFVVDLPGIAKLQVATGNAEVARMIADRDQLQVEVDEARRRWGFEAFDELEARVRERDRLAQTVKPVSEAALAAARAQVLDAASLDGLSGEARRQEMEALPGRIEEAEARWREAQEAYQKVADEHRRLMADNQTAQLKSAVDALRAAVGQAPPGEVAPPSTPPEADEAFVGSLSALSAPWGARLEAMRNTARNLAATAVRPEGEEMTRGRLEQLQDELEAVEREAEGLNQRVHVATGQIQGQGDLYARLVRAEEELARLEADQARVELEAQSMRLLRETFNKCRERLQQDVVAPLQDRVGRRLSELTRGAYTAVGFDPSFRIKGVTPASASAALPDDLSFGTLEQLMLLTRLCLGEMLGEDGRQVLVLDDNLVHTDSVRMDQACQMLEEAAERMQIVIFTCHPERYRFRTPIGRVDLGMAAV
jgi:hypothetical protein